MRNSANGKSTSSSVNAAQVIEDKYENIDKELQKYVDYNQKKTRAFPPPKKKPFHSQSINTTSCKATLAATTLLSPLLAARRCKGPRRASRCLLMRRVVKSPAFAAFAASFTAAEARRTVAEPHPVSRTKARSFAYAQSRQSAVYIWLIIIIGGDWICFVIIMHAIISGSGSINAMHPKATHLGVGSPGHLSIGRGLQVRCSKHVDESLDEVDDDDALGSVLDDCLDWDMIWRTNLALSKLRDELDLLRDDVAASPDLVRDGKAM